MAMPCGNELLSCVTEDSSTVTHPNNFKIYMYIQYSYARLYNGAQHDYTNKSKNHTYLHHMVTHRKLAMLRGYQKIKGQMGLMGQSRHDWIIVVPNTFN